jgi:hypothetical protein
MSLINKSHFFRSRAAGTDRFPACPRPAPVTSRLLRKSKSITMETMLCRSLVQSALLRPFSRRPISRCRASICCAAILALSGFFVPAAFLHAQDNNTTNRWTRKYKTPPQASRIQVTILKDANGKPVENAAVIFHPIQGDKDKGYLELKSNEDGKAIIDVIPIGDTVRLQVIANGFQTYGGDYKIDHPEVSLEVRMKRPGAQYSIYKMTDSSTSSGAGGGNGASPNGGKSAAPSNGAPDKNAPAQAQPGQPDSSAPPSQNDKSSGSGSSPQGSSSGSESGSGSGSGQNQNQNQGQNPNQSQSQ